MMLIYNGVLTSSEVGHVRDAIKNGYVHWVEVKDDCPNIYPWCEDNLIKSVVDNVNMLGNDVYSKECHWMKVAGRLYCFKHGEDHKSFLRDFGDFIVNPKPFKIAFDVPNVTRDMSKFR